MNWVAIYDLSKRFLIALLIIYALLWIFHYYQVSKITSEQETARQFTMELNRHLQLKAGEIIKNNGIHPLVASTLLRVSNRLPDGNITGYRYQDNILQLKISNAGSDPLVHVRDIINYADVYAKDGWMNVAFN